VDSVHSVYDCSFRLYKKICAFESFTGGGGDGDLSDGDNEDTQLDQYATWLEGARGARKDVGKLSVKDIVQFLLLQNVLIQIHRFSENPNVIRPVACHSGGEISASDNNIDSSDDDDNPPLPSQPSTQHTAKLDQTPSTKHAGKKIAHGPQSDGVAEPRSALTHSKSVGNVNSSTAVELVNKQSAFFEGCIETNKIQLDILCQKAHHEAEQNHEQLELDRR
jgi:hypothetical protein